jgi:hypothetical protein
VIGPDRLTRVTAKAVVPEQVVPYVTAVGGGRPRWFGACVGYLTEDHAVVVGYPVHDPLDRSAMEEAVGQAVASPEVRRITFLGPARPPQAPPHVNCVEDGYYGVILPVRPPRQKLRNLLRRAQRELKIDRGRDLTPDHDAMVKQYLDGRSLAPGTRRIYSRLHRYLEASPGSLIFSARHGDGRLAAFAIGEFSALSSAFFMFCFRDPWSAPPGSADLVLSALIGEAQDRGQERVNLGLGIHPGIRSFKEKWGAELLFPYVEVTWEKRTGKDS